MRTSENTKLTDISSLIFIRAMLAVMAQLFIRLILAYTAVCVWVYTLYPSRLLYGGTYAQKRTSNRIVYRCKFALFRHKGQNAQKTEIGHSQRTSLFREAYLKGKPNQIQYKYKVFGALF